MLGKIDIDPKPLEQIPVKRADQLVKEVMQNLEVTPSKTEIKLNWSDTVNIIKRLITQLTVYVYTGNIGVKFFAIIIVVALFLLFSLLSR